MTMKKGNCSKDPTWAWVSLIGIAYTQILLNGLVRSFGIIYIELLEVYQEGPLTTGWIPSAYAMAIIVIAPVSGVITRYVSTRWMVIACSVGGTLSLIGCSMAPNIYVVIITYGVLFGSFSSVTFCAIAVSLNTYFKHNLALANGIAMSGASLGGMFIPFLYQVILEKYALGGTFLIMAGLWLNLCVVGALLRPFSEVLEHVNEENISDDATNNGVSEKTERKKSENDISDKDTTISLLTHIVEPQPNKLWLKSKLHCGPVLGYKYLTLLVFWFSQTFGTFSSMMAIPPYANELHFTKSEISSLLTFLSGSDTIARLILGYIGDIKVINKSLLISTNVTIVAVIMFLVPLMTQFWHFALFSVAVGMFASSSGVYFGPFIIESVGREHLGPGVGFMSMTFGIANTVAPLSLGGLREATGTYLHQFRMAAIALLVGTFIFCVVGRRILSLRTLFSRKRQKDIEKS